MSINDTASLISLGGRHALVTGGGSGIGRATSEMLAAAGAHVLVLDRNLGPAQETVELITARGGTAEPVAVDVTEEANVKDCLQSRPIDILINAAGIIVRKSLLDTSLDEWNRVIAVNLTGYFTVLKATVPALSASRHGGRIVQIASVSAQIGYGYPAYTAAKGGVLSLTRELAGELAPLNIRINSISPGVVETGINRDTLGMPGPIRDATIGATPLGRLGAPADIAKAALFLVSDLADFVTGTNVLVDGGLISKINWGEAGESLQNAHRSERGDATTARPQ
ncbi:MAG: family oxidoreductase [Mycobacterium sp.]|nr:family oxidoreductase [Mycobacterium sp.]